MGYFDSIYADDRLPHRAKAVYFYLRDRADAEGKCWPGVKRIAAVADCGVGLYAGECVNALREFDPDLMLFVVTPHEEQATKWHRTCASGTSS